jgi:plastocyanin
VTTKTALAAAIILATALGIAISVQAALPSPRGNLTCAFAVVEIRDGSFSPGTVQVYKNATVTWVNKGPSDHALSVGDHLSPLLFPGDTYSINFHEFGTYNYSSRFHGGERGVVIVK